MRRSRSEQGFTLVEVLVAMLITVTLVAGLALAMGGAARTQGAATVKAKMASTAEGIYESLRSDRGWMANCNGTCNLAAAVPAALRQDEQLDVTWQITATARSVAATAAGTDLDSVAFEVTIRIAVPAADRARLGNPDEFVLMAGIDRSGEHILGSVLVEICAAWNQADDRLAIGGCAGSGPTNIRMHDCRSADPCGVFNSIAHLAPHDTTETPHVQTRRIDLGFTLSSPVGGTHGSGGATRLGPGAYLFTNLPTGNYTVNIAETTTAGGRRLTRWHTQDVPQQNTVSVEIGQRSNALIAYRANPTSGDIRIRAERTVRHINTANRTHVIDRGWNMPWADPSLCREDGMYLWYTMEDFGGVTNLYDRLGLTEGVDYADNSGWWWCVNRIDKARFHYLAPTVTATNVWQGSGVAATKSTWPEPRGRLVERTGQNTYSSDPLHISATLTARGNWYGSPRRPPAPNPATITLTGLHAGLYHPVASTITNPNYINCTRTGVSADAPCPRVYQDRIWVNATNGHINGAQRHDITLRTEGECYVTMNGPTWREFEQTLSTAAGSWLRSGSSSWTMPSGSYSYTERETSGAECNVGGSGGGGACPSVWWRPGGGYLHGACTLLYKQCDVTEYYIGERRDSQPMEVRVTGPVGDPLFIRHAYDVEDCDGFNPPLPCDANGENCDTNPVVHIPVRHVATPIYYRAVNVQPSLVG